MGNITQRTLKNGTTSYSAEAWGHGRRKSRTFKSEREARHWITDMERDLESPNRVDTSIVLRDAIDRYIREAPTFHKPKSQDSLHYEYARLDKFRRLPVADIPIAELTRSDGNELIDYLLNPTRGKKPTEATVMREMSVLRGVLRQCEDWYGLQFPWTRLKRLDKSPPRRRNITDTEIDRIMAASAYDRTTTPVETSQLVCAMFLFAIETGMRQGEIANLTPAMLDSDKYRFATLPWNRTKSRKMREVPISEEGRRILKSLPIVKPTERMFRCSAATASSTFRKIVNRAGLPPGNEGGFTFHDARHLACKRFVAKNIQPMELIRILGHTSVNQTMTYFHPDVEDFADKLDEYDTKKKLADLEKEKSDTDPALAAALALVKQHMKRNQLSELPNVKSVA